MKHTFIATPGKSGKPDGSLASPFRMEYATLEFTEQGGTGQRQVLITNRCGDMLRLDLEAARALGFLLAKLEKSGELA